MNRHFFAILSLIVAVITSAAEPAVVAHRGYWRPGSAAPNSIKALIQADSIGCYGSEFDVWITSDNVLVVNHDSKIGGKVIETTKSSKLLKQRLANGEKMPSLSQFLDAAKDLDIQLILELKVHKKKARETQAILQILKMVKEKGLEDRMTYITFSPHALRLFAVLSDNPVYFLKNIDPVAILEAGGSGADYSISYLRRNPEMFDRCREIGMPINVWTVNDPADMQFCIDHGADFVTTDRPEMALEMTAQPQSDPEIESEMEIELYP